AGLETGVRDRASYVLKQDKIRLVLTTPLNAESPINDHLRKHGDGVKVAALWVEDARSAFEETTKRGAKPFMEPTVERDEFGEVVRSGIYTYGDTVHVFVERKNYNGVQPGAYRTQVHRPHGWKRGLGRNEYLGEMVRRRHGIRELPFLRRQANQHRVFSFDE